MPFIAISFKPAENEDSQTISKERDLLEAQRPILNRQMLRRVA
jgi:hypothetical protein